MKKRQLQALALAALMAASTLTACGSSGSSTSTTAKSSDGSESGEEVDTSIDMEGEPYTVNFLYLVAMEGSDQQAVNEAVNELTMKELNMKVNMIPMTFGTYNNQLSLMLSSGEPLDIFAGFSGQFATYIASDYIINLDDYSEYTKDIYEVMGEEDADAGHMGDFLVGFSNMKERSYPAGLICRKDIFEELGFSLDDFNVTVDDYSSFDKITELFAAVHEAYPDMVVFDGTSTMGIQTESYGDNMGNVYGYLENYGQTTTVTNWFESEQYRKFAEINREWFQAGYTSKDIATNTDSGELKVKAGNCFSYITNVKINTDVEKLAQTGYEVVVIPLSERMKHTNAVCADLLCVCSAAEDPVKAVQFLNWSYTSQEFNDLINWGIEGVDWELTEDGMARYPDGVDASSVGYHNDYGFIYPNQFVGHAWEGNPSDIWEQYEVYNEETPTSQAFGFFFDATEVETQITQLQSVYDQYYKMVAFGVVDPDEGIQEFNDALYAAGLQDVIDAKQAQLDEWLAAQ